MVDKYRLRANFDEIVWRVEKARIERSEHHIVHIVTISKYVTPAEVALLYELGQRAFGENRVQELHHKVEALEELPIEWHFVGRLQKNKINRLIDLDPWLIHSLDSLELAKELDKRLAAKGKKVSALLQINSAREPTKAGVSPEEAYDTYLRIIEETAHIDLQGVMSIGAHTEDTKRIEESFQTTYKIYEALKPHGATLCSMGMSNDFELAIRCGSNMVRIGSLFFK
ncbi:MAG: YggS family pyridoxal phosphate-dependent enzyme [Nitratiruptor sp.]|nr:YggS family pyridoxal phosphate-dependent enzyme [Nitratiruptor sp.]NPA83204.1 YggS family pyridoxal phosphate-dependent enzyme [Campylobacterota bacterium]